MSSNQPQKHREFPGQHDDEDVQFMFRQHPLVMRKQLLGGLFIIVFGVLPLDFYGILYTNETLYGWFIKIALIVPLLVFAWWFHRWVGWYYSMYLVTNRRIIEIKQKGFFDRSVQEWQLDKIYNVNYHVNGLQAVIFGFGDITVTTVTGDFTMPTIHKPTEIYHQLLEAVRAGGGSLEAPTPFDKRH